MKKLRMIIACLALALGITGTAVATNIVPAHAVTAGDCVWIDYSNSFTVKCSTLDYNYAGNGTYRAGAKCWNGALNYTGYGAIVTIGHWSTVVCSSGYYTSGAEWIDHF